MTIHLLKPYRVNLAKAPLPGRHNNGRPTDSPSLARDGWTARQVLNLGGIHDVTRQRVPGTNWAL